MKPLFTLLILLSSLLCCAQRQDIPTGDLVHIKLSDSILERQATAFKVIQPDTSSIFTHIQLWAVIILGIFFGFFLVMFLYFFIDRTFTSSITVNQFKIVNKIHINREYVTAGITDREQWFFVINRSNDIGTVECHAYLYAEHNAGDIITVCDEYGILSGKLTNSKIITDED